jgi:hypothetical protein
LDRAGYANERGRDTAFRFRHASFKSSRPCKNHKVSDYVFPGSKPHRPLSVMALEMVLRRAKIDVTVHGFRSAFRDWSGKRTAFPREVAEAALANLGDQTERAYRRGDALEKRRALMETSKRRLGR